MRAFYVDEIDGREKNFRRMYLRPNNCISLEVVFLQFFKPDQKFF